MQHYESFEVVDYGSSVHFVVPEDDVHIVKVNNNDSVNECKYSINKECVVLSILEIK